jgi:hypothetical protein
LTGRKLLEAAPEDIAGCKTCRCINLILFEVILPIGKFENLSCPAPTDYCSFFSDMSFVERIDLFKFYGANFHDRFGKGNNTKVIFLSNYYMLVITIFKFNTDYLQKKCRYKMDESQIS